MKRLLALLTYVVCSTLAWGQTAEGLATATDEFSVVGVGDKVPSFEVSMYEARNFLVIEEISVDELMFGHQKMYH